MTTRAAVIIKEGDKVLLVQEGTRAVYGLWCWTQGAVEEGETPEVAAVREAKEEVGLDVVLGEKVAIIKNPFPGTKEIHVFVGSIAGGEIVPMPGEILQTKWFTREELEAIKDKTPGPWIYEVISKVLQ